MGARIQPLRWLFACMVLAGCCWLGWAALRTWRSTADVNAAQDLALRQGSGSALPYLALAAGYRPGRAKAWRLLARFSSFAHPRGALRYAQRAVAVDPDDWRNWDEVGLIEFQLDAPTAARRALARAVQRDSGWEAHYQLGNLAFLLGRNAEFWAQLKAALAVVVAWQAEPLLREAAAHAGSDVNELLAVLPRDRADIDARAVRLLLRRRNWLTAGAVWREMRCRAYHRAECRSAALALSNGLAGAVFHASGRATRAEIPGQHSAKINSGELAAAARHGWNLAVDRQVITADRARVGVVNDGDFEHSWLGPAFAWAKDGPVYISREPGIAPVGDAVRIGFDGYEPQNTGLFFQYVAVIPGAEYEVSYLARREGEGTQTGVALWVRAAPAAVLLKLPARLGPRWETSQAMFRVPMGTHLIALSFEFHRPLGEVRLRNSILLARVQLEHIEK